MLARSALIDGMDVVSAGYAHKGRCVVIRVPHIFVYTDAVYASRILKQVTGGIDRISS